MLKARINPARQICSCGRVKKASAKNCGACNASRVAGLRVASIKSLAGLDSQVRSSGFAKRAGLDPKLLPQPEIAPEFVDTVENPPEDGLIQATEESGIHKQWYAEAESKEMDLGKAFEFIYRLGTKYRHDYGTICHAIVAGALATAHAIDRTPQGGITGFQAGCIMWEFIRHWNHIEGPARLVTFERMLYPQYADEYEKVISEDTWVWLQDEARKKISQIGQPIPEDDPLRGFLGSDTYGEPHPEVLRHWESIVNGIVPFGYKVENLDCHPSNDVAVDAVVANPYVQAILKNIRRQISDNVQAGEFVLSMLEDVYKEDPDWPELKPLVFAKILADWGEAPSAENATPVEPLLPQVN